jgi:hypothetical protein
MHPVSPLPSPRPHVHLHAHRRRLLVVWNQDGFLGGIVASVVDRRYPRTSVHGCDGSDRLKLVDTVACGEVERVGK